MADDAAKRVLVIDDAGLVRRYYRDALETAGFDVAEALNGLEALEHLLGARFDLVIVDVNMPGMDGLSFIRDIRRRSESVATIPTLIITTEAGEQDVADARSAGANYYLVKPVSERDLIRHVAALAGAPP